MYAEFFASPCSHPLLKLWKKRLPELQPYPHRPQVPLMCVLWYSPVPASVAAVYSQRPSEGNWCSFAMKFRREAKNGSQKLSSRIKINVTKKTKGIDPPRNCKNGQEKSCSLLSSNWTRRRTHSINFYSRSPYIFVHPPRVILEFFYISLHLF